jgi:queuine tRNA-ribosyltransferase
VNEILAKYLATIHNISFYAELMEEIRKNIKKKTIEKWAKTMIEKCEGGFDD